MKKPQLIILGALALLALIAAFITHQTSKPSSSGTTGSGQKLFRSFPLNDVAEIKVSGTGGSAVVKRIEAGWVVPDRGNYAADYSAVSQALRNVWEMTTAQAVTVGVSQLPRLELVKPAEASGDKKAGTLIEFKDANGKELAWLLVGKELVRETSQQPMMMNFGGSGRYVMTSASPGRAWVVNDSLSQFRPQPADWLDKSFFSVSGIKSIEVKEGDAVRWRAERLDASADIQIIPSGPKEQLDPDKVRPLGNVLSYANFTDVLPKDAPVETIGMDKPLDVLIETFDAFKYELRIGKPDDKNARHVTVSVSAQIKEKREPGKDEKPEDKERLDKEFAAKLKVQKEKLDKEKKLEGWIYLVPEGTLENLLKARADFAKAPPAEPAKKDDTKDDTKDKGKGKES